ncbi:MAG: SAM-dependent methyltransferase, partial [Candidatus Nitrotoga sp.]
ITSALAASADLGISLTRRGVSRSVVFVTPRVGEGESASDWIKSVSAADTAVLYMASGQVAGIAASLMQHGLPGSTPVAYVSNASLPGMQKIVTTLSNLHEAAQNVGSPALIILGEVLRACALGASTQEIPEEISQLINMGKC